MSGGGQDRRQIVAQVVGRLVGRPHDEAARGGVGAATTRARLEGTPAEPLADHPLRHHALGPLEGGVGVARLDLVLVFDVAGRIVEELGAPSAIAAKTSVTAGSGSQSTRTSAAASTASTSEVAMTAATASPTWRTRPTESG